MIGSVGVVFDQFIFTSRGFINIRLAGEDNRKCHAWA